MEIQLINHACVLYKMEGVRLLCDPWLSGSVFHNGWDLLAPSQQTIAELDFTHLWISHEHPDHFHPPDLKRIPPERRKNIPVYYQRTKDRKVVEYLAAAGFPVVEMEPLQPYCLSGTVRILNGVSAGCDSWLAVQSDGKTVLNLNDCRVDEPREMESILKAIASPVDALMTQFGYANWAGNQDDAATARIARQIQNAQLSAQLQYLKPKWTIPFASFVRFSHEENDFWNEHAINVFQAVKQIESESSSKPLILFLGDSWEIGRAWNNAPALAKWENAYEAAKGSPRKSTQSADWTLLQESFHLWQQRIRANNDWNAILALKTSGELEASRIFLSDHQKGCTLDVVDGLSLNSAITSSSADIVLSSECLDYVFKNRWGRGTLSINGRFQANYKTLALFFQQTAIDYANNIGLRYPETIPKSAILQPKSFILEMLQKAHP